MKKRTGFVSNSSTSSFIIGIKTVPEPCPHCGRGGTDLVKMLESHDHCETSVEWTDADDRIKDLEVESAYWRTQGWDEGVADNQRQIDLLKDAKDRFPTVIGVAVSFHDEFLNHLITEMNDSGEITILQGV
jgi:hypothetical protein